MNIISERIINQGKRPLLKDVNVIDTLIEKNEERIDFYTEADIHILNESRDLSMTIYYIIDKLILNKVVLR